MKLKTIKVKGHKIKGRIKDKSTGEKKEVRAYVDIYSDNGELLFTHNHRIDPDGDLEDVSDGDIMLGLPMKVRFEAYKMLYKVIAKAINEKFTEEEMDLCSGGAMFPIYDTDPKGKKLMRKLDVAGFGWYDDAEILEGIKETGPNGEKRTAYWFANYYCGIPMVAGLWAYHKKKKAA